MTGRTTPYLLILPKVQDNLSASGVGGGLIICSGIPKRIIGISYQTNINSYVFLMKHLNKSPKKILLGVIYANTSHHNLITRCAVVGGVLLISSTERDKISMKDEEGNNILYYLSSGGVRCKEEGYFLTKLTKLIAIPPLNLTCYGKDN